MIVSLNLVVLLSLLDSIYLSSSRNKRFWYFDPSRVFICKSSLFQFLTHSLNKPLSTLINLLIPMTELILMTCCQLQFQRPHKAFFSPVVCYVWCEIRISFTFVFAPFYGCLFINIFVWYLW